ncbi:MAG TPA: 3'(2'),5'-bisphosphate nucleotidase CysQ [Acidimicrobiales bacterium]|nr:3'(2'),5'-bisphosphate nucleotidase CysQ [Acidimicrobiales bacterium]
MSDDHTADLSDGELATRLASSTGRLVMEVRNGAVLAGADLGGAGDAVAQEYLARALAAVRPDQAVLSEEGTDDPARLGRSAVWLVDPLDGTREYAEGRNDFAVHVALAVDGEAVAGAVSLPALGVTYTTAHPPRLGGAPGDRLRLVVSRSRPPAFAEAVAEHLGGDLVPMGSTGAKAMAVLRGEADAYLHAGGHHEWDSAAPVAVARSAGLHASRIDGSPLRYNQPDPFQADLLVCRRELTGRLLDSVARAIRRAR